MEDRRMNFLLKVETVRTNQLLDQWLVILNQAAREFGLERIGTHSLRKHMDIITINSLKM